MEMRRGIDNKVVSRQFIDYFKSCLSISVNRKNDYLSGGYPEQLFEKMWKLCDSDNLKKDAKILVVNDYALECVYELLKRNFTNITILVTHERVMHAVSSCLNKYYKIPVKINTIKIDEVHNLKPEFDLIIANPPYSCANKIIDAIVTSAKCSVILAPISCYRNRNLWEYVDSGSVILVDPDQFFDASITKSLCICSLNNSSKNKPESYRQLKLFTYDIKYRNFYQKNQETKFLYPFVGDDHIQKNYIDKGHPIYVDRDFVADVRFVTLTTHDKNRNAVDVRWNILRQQMKIEAGAFVIHFGSEVSVNNFRRFFYENQLSVELIRGLHETGTIFPIDAIPHIDYSVDRDYEHLTVDDIMKILEEENK